MHMHVFYALSLNDRVCYDMPPLFVMKCRITNANHSCGHSNASALKVQGRSTTLTSQGGTIMHFDVVLHVPVNLPEASEGQQDLHHASSHSDCTPQSSVDQGDGQPKGGGRHRVGQRDGSNHCEERSQRPSLVNGGSGGSGTPRLVGAAEELRIALVAVPDRWKVALLKFWDDPYMHAETQVGRVCVASGARCCAPCGTSVTVVQTLPL